MPRKARPRARPTDAELAVLQVLWTRREPVTVREVHDALRAGQDVGYTTVLKTMQIMAEKGLVTRDTSERAHRYVAAQSEEQTQRGIVADVLERAFRGSAHKMIMQALSSRHATADEIEEIRRLLDDMSGDE